jgi:hypothetical protein
MRKAGPVFIWQWAEVFLARGSCSPHAARAATGKEKIVIARATATSLERRVMILIASYPASIREAVIEITIPSACWHDAITSQGVYFK